MWRPSVFVWVLGLLKKKYFFKTLAEQLVAFQPTGFLHLCLAPWCRCLHVCVWDREECGAVRWGIAEDQSSPWRPLTCSVTMAGLFLPLWGWARWLGQQSLTFERAGSLVLGTPVFEILLPLLGHSWPGRILLMTFFGDDHVTTPWSIESSVIRAVDLDFHSVLTTNELSDLSEHFCFFLSLFVK